ncbi:MAG TPA: hypothetical protein VKB79_03540 [Bryobacteraceae bacterium]|nr:hypothetical protein [Bryobacteraceae bacterium]
MLVVVGGHSRNIGKTSVVCGIVRGLPEMRWTAAKITQFGHGVCTRGGEPCECADPRHPVAMSEEHGADPATDSGRFLAAGAARSFWLRTPAGGLGEGMTRLREILSSSANVVLESNSVLGFLKPDVCLMVVDGSVEDFKATSQRFLDRADALVVTSAAPLHWPKISPALIERKPRFEAFAPRFESPDLIDFIGLKLRT